MNKVILDKIRPPLMPIDVNGNVLSLIAKQANNGRVPASNLVVWSDRSKYGNNCTMTNQAGTALSGFNSEFIRDKKVWYNRLDGTDDFGSLVNTPSLDITTGEFAIACTFRVNAALTSFIMCKTLSETNLTQYGILYNASNLITLYLNGVSRASGSNNSVLVGVWYNVIYYRNSSGRIDTILNQVTHPINNYSNSLISQPNLRLGTRTTNAEGTTYLAYFKGDIATQSIYWLPSGMLNINKIILAETNISKELTLVR